MAGWIIIGVLIACSIFFVLDYLYKKTNDYQNTCIDIKKYREGIPYGLQMVNLGSTYAKFAFGTYDDLGINGCDLSLQAQSLEMDRAILQKYVDHIASGGIVVFVAAACLLLYREQKDNLLYYQILEKAEDPQYTIQGKIKSAFPLLADPRKIKRLIIDTDAYSDIYATFPLHMEQERSERELKALVGVWETLFSLKDLKGTDLPVGTIDIIQHNSGILSDMLDFCRHKRLVPIVVIPPFSQRLNRYFSVGFKEKVLTRTIQSITIPRDIPFLDYQFDREFQDAPELFADGGFRLNRRGSKIFFRRLAEDLQKYGIVISNATMGKRKEG